MRTGRQQRLGLVLSGGGAKGAYQVGVVRALAELNQPVQAMAGASIGALNAAVVCGAGDLVEGHRRLEKLWDTLAEEPPLQPNWPVLLRTLGAFGLAMTPVGRGARLGALVLGVLANREQPSDTGILSDKPLQRMLDRFLDLDALALGLPLHVSAYETRGAGRSVAEWASAQVGMNDNRHSTYFHVQSLPRESQREALMASAALPLLFKARELNGKRYADGGLGASARQVGNTPVDPLVANGCTHVIVCHLNDGSMWTRDRHPNVTAVEIRPQHPIRRTGELRDLLGFDRRQLQSWREQGYEDAMHCMGRVLRAGRELKAIENTALRETLAGPRHSRARLDAAMRRLREDDPE